MTSLRPRASTVVVALFWAGLLLGPALWWADTRAVSGTAEWLTGAGRITGLTGGYVLLVQVVLMSRVFDRWLDATMVSGWHRDLGGYLVAVLVAHVALITAGYAAADGTSLTAQTWTLLTRYEDMIAAYAGFAVLLAVALLAVRPVRRWLRYELFYYTHLAAYVSLLLVYGHQFSTGAQLAHSGPARYWWIGLYAFAIGCVAYGRLVRPLWLAARHRFRVASVIPEAPGVVSVYVTGRGLGDLRATGGQFFRWRFLTRDGWWQAHPFSLSAAPNGRWLRLTVKTVGDGSAAVAGLRPGVRVLVEGPSGGFTARRRRGHNALLIAGGIGVAPVRALLEDLPPGGSVLYRASRPEDLVFRSELDELAAARGHRVRYLVGSRRDPRLRHALSADGLRGLVPDVARRDVYVCGPPSLVAGVLDALTDLRVPRRHIHLDPFEL
ncbi:ferric reductase-like transmembrane domain-containing protein [Longispora sp. K20-0274]|uniref:ferredoxin reductase family protein n=1 Tax=Longispora sp. K20-0274 TaxID=3088255 RepID=UPI00399AB5CD